MTNFRIEKRTEFFPTSIIQHYLRQEQKFLKSYIQRATIF